MPTTLTGLLIFVVLLLPGFAYLVGKERNGTERHTSPFRETVAVVAASVTSELVVLALFALVRWLGLPWAPGVGALIGRSGGAYAISHYRSLATLGLILLAFSVALAYVATVPRVRRCFAGWPVIGGYPHESTVSAWWLIFEQWRYKRDAEVCCILNDGSAIRGQFASFNNSADDSPDREVILLAPIRYRPPGGQMADYPAGVASVAARDIAVLFAAYSGAPQITRRQRKKHSASPLEVAPVEQGAALAGPQAQLTAE